MVYVRIHNNDKVLSFFYVPNYSSKQTIPHYTVFGVLDKSHTDLRYAGQNKVMEEIARK